MRHIALFLSLFLSLAIGTTAFAQAGEGSYDNALDEYESLLKDALNIKERAASGEQIPQYEIYGLTSRLNTIRKSLAEVGGSMSEIQKSRLAAIKRYYAAVENGSSVSSTPWVRPMEFRQTLSSTSESVFPLPNLESVAKPLSLHPFALLTCSGLDAVVPGIRLGVARKRIGAYLAASFSPGRKASAYDCLQNGSIPSGGSIYTTGETSIWHFSLSAGGLWLPFYFGGRDFAAIGLYAGAGYGCRNLYWEDIESRWARVSDCSHQGLATEAGVILFRGRLAFSAGVRGTAFRHADAELGLGLRF